MMSAPVFSMAEGPRTGTDQGRASTWDAARRARTALLPSVRALRAPARAAAPRSRRRTEAIFTGIVEEMGTVSRLELVGDGWEMDVRAKTTLEGVTLGDSIAVNGTCLTVTRFNGQGFSFGLAPETLRRTSLGELASGSPVNLERSLQPSGRMGGHFVQGHVDGTGVIRGFRPEGDSMWVTVAAPPEVLRYLVPKGYVAVDGTSLTVCGVDDATGEFTFMLVAYTQQKIVVARKQPGAKVNLEVDIVGKYVERMLPAYAAAAQRPLK